jgi:eukaryotic-like serine/threonine-protein kinase
MSNESAKCALLDQLAEEFAERYRQGERPSLQEYTDRYPHLAADIRDVFPAMVEIEQAEQARGQKPADQLPKGPPAAPLETQQIGDYRILREVGRGGMGIVYEAEQVSLARRVALKILPLSGSKDGPALERFRREARSAARLHHTNIVPVFEVGQDGDVCYYAMQFIQGQGLDLVIDELRRLRQESGQQKPGGAPVAAAAENRPRASQAARSLLTGRFNPAVADVVTVAPAPETPDPGAAGVPAAGNTTSSAVLPGETELSSVESDHRHYFQSVARVGQQVAAALAYAHARGIVHRDIKPSNLLLDAAGVVWVADFGLAKSEDEALNHTGDLIGTLRYMAPERFRGECDARADIYALGLTLYELLALRWAFPAQDRVHLFDQVQHHEPARPRFVDPRVPRDLETIVLKAMDKDPRRRYQTADELAEDLHRFLADEPIRARRVSLAERLARWARHNPAVASLVAALLLVFLGGFAGVFWQWQEAKAAGGRAAQLAAQEADARHNAERAQQAEAEAKQKALWARDQAEDARQREEGLRLVAQSMAALPADPGLALLLSIEGAERSPGLLANNALLAALDVCHEQRTLREDEGTLRSAVFSADGKQILTVSGDEIVRLRDDGSDKVLTTVRGYDLVKNFGASGYIRTFAALSPDGKRLLTSYDGAFGIQFKNNTSSAFTDRVAHLWDAANGQFLFTLRGHTDHISTAAFSPDGRRIVTAAHDGTARLWDAASGQEVLCLRGHQMPLVAALFSPNGERVLTLSANPGQRRLYLQFPGTPLPDLDPLVAVPFNRKDAVGWGGGGTQGDSRRPEADCARVWDATTGQELAVLKRPKDSPLRNQNLQPTWGAFSPDGRRVLTCFKGGDGLVALWDPTSGVVLGLLRDRAVITAAWFSPDGRRVLTLSAEGARLWDAETCQPLASLKGHTRPVVAAEFSPDGRWVVTASDDRTARVWDAATGEDVAVLRGHELKLISAAFSPDSQQVVTASADQTVRLWRVLPPRDHAAPLGIHKGPVSSVVYNPDGSRLLTTCENQPPRIWDARTRQELAVLLPGAGLAPAARERIFGPVRQAAFSPDGSRVLTAAADQQACLVTVLFGREMSRTVLPFTPARLWDAETGKELLGLEWQAEKGKDHPNFPGMGQKNGLDRARFSADGKRLLTVENGMVHLAAYEPIKGGLYMSMGTSRAERAVRVWDAAAGKELAALRGQEVIAAEFSPDGQRVLTSSWLAPGVYALRVWDTTTGKDLLTLNLADEDRYTYALFSADGSRILGFHRDRLRVWDAEGKELGQFATPERSPNRNIDVSFATLSPDGRLAVAVAGNEASLWDAATGKPLSLLTGHLQQIHSAQFSPDGKLLVTASEDETARVWNTTTGKEWYTLTGHNGPVRCACFSPDGRTVATASVDGTARLWQLELLPIAWARKPRALTALERKHFEIGEGAKR